MSGRWRCRTGDPVVRFPFRSWLAIGSCLWNRLRATLLALVASVSLAAVASANAVEAQEASQEGGVVRLTARVSDAKSNEALLGAVIELGGMVSRHVTGVDGRAVMDVPRGRYKVTVRRWGYEKLAGDLEVIRSGELKVAMHRTRYVDLDAPGRLLVRVVNGESGDPIEGALVSLPEGGSRVTDRSGQAKFENLRQPVARFAVETAGYGKRTAPVALRPDRTTAVRVEMTVETAAPRPIEIEMRSRFLEAAGTHDFLARRGKRTHVLTRDMLDQLAVTRLTDAFRTLPGIRVDRLSSGAIRLVNRSRCSLILYVDGVRRVVDGDVRRRFVVDDLPPESVELIEVWENPSCGTVLIWTR